MKYSLGKFCDQATYKQSARNNLIIMLILKWNVICPCMETVNTVQSQRRGSLLKSPFSWYARVSSACMKGLYCSLAGAPLAGGACVCLFWHVAAVLRPILLCVDWTGKGTCNWNDFQFRHTLCAQLQFALTLAKYEIMQKGTSKHRILCLSLQAVCEKMI